MPKPGRPVTALLIALTVLAVQLPALSGELIWDDHALLRDSDLYTSSARLEEALSSPLGKETFYWRPLATTSFLVETAVHGGAVWAYRLTNALLHAGAAALAFLLLTRLWGALVPAALGALLWALHPVQVEAVTWPSGRFDVLAGLLCLATLAAVPRDAGARWGPRHVAVGVLTALALLSKEFALFAPVYVLCWSLATGPGGLRAATGKLRTWPWRPAAASVAGVFAALLIRYEVVGSLLRARPFEAPFLERVLTVGKAVFTYALVFVFPFETVGPAHHSAHPIPVGEVTAWLGLALALGLVLLAARMVLRVRLGWMVVALVAALVPVSQLVPLDLAGSLHAADRYVYLPSFLAITVLGAKLLQLTAATPASALRLGKAAVALLVVFVVYRTAFVVPRWSSEIRFWERARAMAPRSDVVLANLFHQYWGAGRVDDAEAVVDQLVNWYPKGGYFVLRAHVLRHAGEPEGALREIEKDLALHGEDPKAHVLHAEQLVRLGRTAEALASYERALALETASKQPQYRPIKPRALAGAAASMALTGSETETARAWLTEAREEVETGDQDTWLAIAWASLALADDPGALEAVGRIEGLDLVDWRMLIELSAARVPDGKASERILAGAREAGMDQDVVLGARAGGFARARSFRAAAATYQEACEANPDAWDWPFFLFQLVRDDRVDGDVVEIGERLVRIRPESAEAHDLLGYVVYEAGDAERAEVLLRRALALDAGYAEARYHLGMLLVRTGREAEGRKALEEALESARRKGDTDVVALIQRALR